MPCMSNKKENKEPENKKNERNNSTAKKVVQPQVNVFKQVVTKIKNGGKHREVGT